MGRHVFLEYMSFRMTFTMGAFALQAVVGGHLLWEDMSCHSACLQDGIIFRMMCLTGMHVLQEDMSYLRYSCRRSCLTGVHVLQEYMFYRKPYLTG